MYMIIFIHKYFNYINIIAEYVVPVFLTVDIYMFNNCNRHQLSIDLQLRLKLHAI